MACFWCGHVQNLISHFKPQKQPTDLSAIQNLDPISIDKRPRKVDRFDLPGQGNSKSMPIVMTSHFPPETYKLSFFVLAKPA